MPEELRIVCQASSTVDLNIIQRCSYDRGPPETCTWYKYKYRFLCGYCIYCADIDVIPSGESNFTIDRTRFTPGPHILEIRFDYENVSSGPSPGYGFRFFIRGT